MVLVHHRARKLETLRVAFFCQLVNFRTAGIWQIQHFCHFVESLARCIVARASQQGVVARTFDINQETVSPAYHQTQVRDKSCRVGDEGGEHVALQVIDCYKGLSGSQCQGFGGGVAYQECCHEPGTSRAGKYIYLVNAAIGFFQCFLQNGGQVCRVVARGKLGDNAAVHAVQGNLG